MIGGGTLLGLANLLIGTSNFQEIQQIAASGDNSSVDILVKDMYKVPPETLDLSTVDSTFGKIASSSL